MEMAKGSPDPEDAASFNTKPPPPPVISADDDAGALFVLESKGGWVHAGYHLTTSIAAPALLSLPWAVAGLGWAAGILFMVLGAAVTFYAYNLLSLVLQHLATVPAGGRRFLRFRDLAHHVVGPRVTRYIVVPMQFIVCFGAVILSLVLGGQSLQLIYAIYNTNGALKLYEFIIFFGLLMMILSQLPSFHSLRYINLLSLIMCFAYSICAIGGSIYAGYHQHMQRDYSIRGGNIDKTFGAFNSFVIIATTYGNGIIPEIQATIAPPVSGKMFKGLCMCYAVVISTFFSVAISGYWAFGNQVAGNVISNLAPSGTQAVVPNWLIFLTNMFIVIQLFAVALVYSQPTFEVLEGKASNATKGMFSFRNVMPRLLLRCVYVAFGTFISAMLPFFADINALLGAFGFTPLDFIFPMLFYNIVFKPSRRSFIFILNTTIIVVFTIVGVLGCIAAVRQIVIDANTYKLFANV